MGDLKGHAIPGSFFVLLGLWWAIGCLRTFLGARKNGDVFKASSTYGFTCFQGRISRLPIEGIVKIIVCTGGMLGELLAHLPVPPMGIVQHATMYLFFLLSGIVDVSLHYGLPLPHGADYISVALALVIEGLLFNSHVHGRPVLDIHVHMLLVYVVFATAIVVALEIRFTKSPILGMARAYLTMLQGTWFWGVGVILYGHGKPNTTWDLDSHDGPMQATIYFSWHCGVHMVLLLLLTLITSCFYRRSEQTPSIGLDKLGHSFLNSDSGEQPYSILSSEDKGVVGSDDEFETDLRTL
ncbi:unnamed protein product [Lymnaea stagnalis]|uniref:Transmembrane protein 45B n=1 Tax=Lymnaea stagnalis TaxID=6523 RepID=A0AAV2I924_LYMST